MPAVGRNETTQYFFSRGEDNPLDTSIQIIVGSPLVPSMSVTPAQVEATRSTDPGLTILANFSYASVGSATSYSGTLSKSVPGTYTPSYAACVLVNSGEVIDILAIEEFTDDFTDGSPDKTFTFTFNIFAR